MSGARTATRGPAHQPTVPEAIAAGVALFGIFLLLQSPSHFITSLDRLSYFADKNEIALNVLVGLIFFTLLWLSAACSRMFKKSLIQGQVGSAQLKHFSFPAATLTALLGGACFWF